MSSSQEELLRNIYQDLGIKEPKPKHLEHLEDGGLVTFSCSNCRKNLAQAWITRPSEPEKWSVKAECCYCNDSSFIQEWQGGFHIAGFEDETVVSDIVFENPIVIKVVPKIERKS